MSTWCTSSGKATALGSRTAWRRWLVKTVDFVMAPSLCISHWDIHSSDAVFLQGLAGRSPSPRASDEVRFARPIRRGPPKGKRETDRRMWVDRAGPLCNHKVMELVGYT